jgi:uncharacterized OsmC-like protein
MDLQTLRDRQAPLKERYRADPDSAITPVHASGNFRDDGITCTVDSWGGPIRAGLHRATGGDGSDACSADMLLHALVGCAGVTLRSVATALRLEIRSATVRADAMFDARGTLGLDRQAPVGIQNVVVTAVVDAEVDDKALERLARSTERYCVVAKSLNVPVEFVVERAG